MDKNIEWNNLGFGYYPTDYNVRCYNRDGKWGELEISSSEYVPVHMAATTLHYGQEAFEGLKAYRGKDNKIRLFRWDENAKRMQQSAEGVMMAPIPIELFKEAVFKAILLNEKFVPPYGTGASLYIRPLLIGSGPEVGVRPAKEYLFIVFVTPVGPYFKEGFNPTKIAIIRDSDRAAPLGTGTLKVGGNYAASLRGIKKAQGSGYSNPMYLDCCKREYIDEIGAANFFAIKGNTYITPKSSSILASITNKSIVQLSEDMGLSVERRPVHIDELSTFDEVGACGTAAVISPIGEIFDIDNNKTYKYCKDGKAGTVSTKLYNMLTGIQFGEIEDKHNWTTIVE
jgi:branched-chain amino acid aminotransferase